LARIEVSPPALDSHFRLE